MGRRRDTGARDRPAAGASGWDAARGGDALQMLSQWEGQLAVMQLSVTPYVEVFP